MKYLFFIGTQAEFIKLLPVMVEMERRHLKFGIIASGQNNLKDIDIFSSLKHKKIDIEVNHQPKKQNIISLLTWWFVTFWKGMFVFNKQKFNNVTLIVHGDTISTLLGAVLGKLFHVRVAHIEAGLRSNDFLNPFPEEINRVLVSRLVDYHFCQNIWSLKNLNRVKGKKVNTKCNTLQESLEIAVKQRNSPLPIKEKYFIFILHRQENLINTTKTKQIIDEITKNKHKLMCIFVLHGNTKQFLIDHDLYNLLKNNRRIKLLDKVPYFSFISLLRKAEFLITDGGSNQEESSYLGLPTLILRQKTERTEGLNHNVVLGGNDLIKIRDFVNNHDQYRYPVQKISFRPSHIIVDTLEKA